MHSSSLHNLSSLSIQGQLPRFSEPTFENIGADVGEQQELLSVVLEHSMRVFRPPQRVGAV
jgi:hypothetical protein